MEERVNRRIEKSVMLAFYFGVFKKRENCFLIYLSLFQVNYCVCCVELYLFVELLFIYALLNFIY